MSVSNTKSWLREQEIAQQRIFMRALALSFALHVGVALIFSFAPKPKPVRSLAVLSVRMVTLPNAPPLTRAAPAKTPAPKPLPAQPKPAPVAKKVILPKRAAPVAKKPKPKPKPLDYDEALAALREELGEETPPPDVPVVEQEIAQVEASEGSPTPSSGAEADPEIVRWRIETLRHLRKVWVVPQEFMNRLLATEVIVTLSSTGDVLGKPEITASSSDPYWDDNVLRALSNASPLPPPPRAGDWTFRFTPEEGN